MTEIAKLKELPNDGFETSMGALWLGIGTFLASGSDIVGLRVQDRNTKIERATKWWFRNIQGHPVAGYWNVFGFKLEYHKAPGPGPKS